MRLEQDVQGMIKKLDAEIRWENVWENEFEKILK
jgi:hypothetical protein